MFLFVCKFLNNKIYVKTHKKKPKEEHSGKLVKKVANVTKHTYGCISRSLHRSWELKIVTKLDVLIGPYPFLCFKLKSLISTKVSFSAEEATQSTRKRLLILHQMMKNGDEIQIKITMGAHLHKTRQLGNSMGWQGYGKY